MLQNAYFEIIFLQKSEPIQPKTSNILPKCCQPTFSPGRTGEAPAPRRHAADLCAFPATSSGRLTHAQPPGGRVGVVAGEAADLCLIMFGKFCKMFATSNIFANFWRARSRLYQNEILQENMRLTAFFKLYKICILLHSRIRFELDKN